MTKFEKFLLHIPVIGIMLLLTMMNGKTHTYYGVTFNDVKTPLIIQLISIVAIFLVAIFSN